MRMDGRGGKARGGDGGGGHHRAKKMKGAHARTTYVGSKRHPEGKGKDWIVKKKARVQLPFPLPLPFPFKTNAFRVLFYYSPRELRRRLR